MAKPSFLFVGCHQRPSYGKFSIESDVWSFGVVMSEIFSFALQPYYGFSNNDVIECIHTGVRLKQPYSGPSDVFNIMLQSLNVQPKERSPFDELQQLLIDLHEFASGSEDNISSIDTDCLQDYAAVPEDGTQGGTII